MLPSSSFTSFLIFTVPSFIVLDIFISFPAFKDTLPEDALTEEISIKLFLFISTIPTAPTAATAPPAPVRLFIATPSSSPAVIFMFPDSAVILVGPLIAI